MGLEVVVGREHAFLHQHALQRVDEVEQVLGVRVADVVDAVRSERQPVLAHLHLGGGVHDAPDALDDVVDVGEVAAAVAHVEDLDGVAAAQLLGEAEVGHVGPAHGAVHREEAQTGGRDGVELGVGGGHQLVGLLGGGVERHRRVDAVLLGERHLLVAAVDRAGAGVDQVLDRVVAACLKDVEEADEVALEVGTRVLDGVADARLGGEVHHDVEAALGEQALDEGGVAQVAANESEAAVGVYLGQHAQARVLDAGVVVAVEVVEADDHVIGLLEQLLDEERADEAGGSGDEDFSICHSYHLVSFKQVACIDLVRHIRELVAPAVGDDHVAAGLEGLQVVRDLGAEELRRIERGLVDHHGHALGLHALHDALDGTRSEVVRIGFHRQAVDAHDRLLLTGIHAVPDHLQHLVSDEVLAGAVGLYNGLDEILRHIGVICQQLLGVLGQAVAAVAEAGVVVVAADARLQAHAVDYVAGVEAADLAVGVELVEVGHAKRQVGVGEEFDGLRLGGSQDELRDAHGAVDVHALELDWIGALSEQAGEALSRRDGLGVLLGRAHHDATGVQVVVERLALAQELRAEEDLAVAQPLAKARGVADGDRGLDDDPGIRVHRAHGGDGGLDGARVEEVPIAVVVGGRRDYGVVGTRVGLGYVHGGVQVELALPRLGLRQEALDLVVLDGRYVAVDLLDFLGHDVQGVHLVVLREQDGEGQADVTGTGDGNLHFLLRFESGIKVRH